MHRYHLCKHHVLAKKDLFVFIPCCPGIFSSLFLEFLAYTFFLLSRGLFKLFHFEGCHLPYPIWWRLCRLLKQTYIGYIFLDIGLDVRGVFRPMTLFLLFLHNLCDSSCYLKCSRTVLIDYKPWVLMWEEPNGYWLCLKYHWIMNLLLIANQE